MTSIGKNVAKNAGTAYAGYLATHLSNPSKVVINRQMERAGQYILVPGSKLAKGIGTGLAIFGVVATRKSSSSVDLFLEVPLGRSHKIPRTSIV